MTTTTQTQFILPLLLMAVANFTNRNPQNGACIKDGTALDSAKDTGEFLSDSLE